MVALRRDQFPNCLNWHKVMVCVALGLNSRPFSSLVHNYKVNASVIAADAHLMNLVALTSEIQCQQTFELYSV